MIAHRESLGRRIFRDTVSVSAVNAVGQVLAYLMSAYVAATFGATWQTDALALALTIPMFTANVVREAVKSVLVPLLVEMRVRGSDLLRDAATSSVALVGLGAAALAVALALAAPWVTAFLGQNLTGEGQALTTRLSLELLPMLPFLCVIGALAAVFNTYGRFRLPAALPALDALVKIAIIAALAGSLGIHALALGNVLGAVVGAVVLWGAAQGAGLLGKARLERAAGGQLGRQALYPLLGLSLLQLNPYIDRYMATPLAPGAVTALSYAERIAAIPYILVGTGFFGVLLAHWSEVAAAEGTDGLRRALRNATAMVVFTLAPLVTLMAVLRVDLVRALLERGAFDPEDTALTAAALTFLALGVLPNYLSLLVSRAFLAIQDTRTPMWLGIANAVLNVTLNALLIGPLGLAGIALSTALTWTLVTLAGWLALRRRLGALGAVSLVRPFAAIVVASLACGALALVVRGIVPGSGFLASVVRLAVAGGAGLAVYAALTWLLRVEEAAKLSFLVRRALPIGRGL